jgi:transglutaminase-like putative cysteine protease
MRVNLDYHFSLNFKEEIKEHRFALRITPRETQFYTIELFDTDDALYHTTDGFGNILSFGDIKEPHNSFEIHSHAKLKFIDTYKEMPDSYDASVFLFSTELTGITASFTQMMEGFDLDNESIESKAKYITHWIFENFMYEKNSTDMSTTVDDVIAQKKGVCQDFAHLMITMLRYYGIPARYVIGFVPGEGESHAWIEYFNGEYWHGADPTHNLVIEHEPYIKIAHGRDAADVYVNQGIFEGGSGQEMHIKAIIGVNQ